MLKRLFLAGLLSLVSASAFAAGTIPFSLSQQFDSLGKPLANCFFFTIQAGTTSTPQSAFQDSALTLALPNPMRCDASGRLPQFFLADGLIKVRITDKNGVAQAYPNGANGIDNIQVIGPSGGGGGGGTVDPTTILATGDLKVSYGTGVLSGFVRANGRTIGSATSGATERANLDTQALFQYLWGADANLAVSGGRGASAAADWAANKTITLPDARGKAIFAADDMGNSPAGKLTAALSGCAGATLGAVCGTQNQNVAQSQLPNTTVSYSSGVTVSSTVGNIIQGSVPFPTFNYSSGGASFLAGIGVGAASGSITSTGSVSGSTSSINGGVTQTGLIMIPPAIIMTYYIKL